MSILRGNMPDAAQSLPSLCVFRQDFEIGGAELLSHGYRSRVIRSGTAFRLHTPGWLDGQRSWI